MTGIFPSELKIAYVVLIYKSGDGVVYSNNRSVYILPVYFKPLEILTYSRLVSHINNSKPLYNYQVWFPKGNSTYLTIMMLVVKVLVMWCNAFVIC